MFNENELEFAIFCIENLASYLGKDPRSVYNALNESGVLYRYIIPGYETLHTQSKEYIVNDIVDVMKSQGVDI